MTEIVSDDGEFGERESLVSSPVPSIQPSPIHSPLAAGRSGRTSTGSALDLGKMTNLSRSYLMTPDDSYRPHLDDDDYGRNRFFEDDYELNGGARDVDDDLLDGRPSLVQSIGDQVEGEQYSIVDSIHSEGGDETDDIDQQTDGRSVATVVSDCFTEQQPLERRLDTIAEESRSHLLNTEPVEKSASPFGAGGPGNYSWNRSHLSQASFSSGDFQTGPGALEVINEAEKDFVGRNAIIQEDARFQNSHNDPENSWDAPVTSPCPVPIQLPRTSEISTPLTSSTFTVDSQRRQSRKAQKEFEWSQRLEKQPPAVNCEESTPFLDCTDVGLTQLPLISTPNGATSASNQSSRRLRQRQRSNLSDAFHSISQLSDANSPIDAANKTPHKERTAESSILNGISNLHLSNASSTAPLSSSAIQRCLQNESTGAEASKLARAILKANQSLAMYEKDKSSRHVDSQYLQSSSAEFLPRQLSLNERSNRSDGERREATSSASGGEARGRTALSDTNSRHLWNNRQNLDASAFSSFNGDVRRSAAVENSAARKSSLGEIQNGRATGRTALSDNNSRSIPTNEPCPSSKTSYRSRRDFESAGTVSGFNKSSELASVSRRSKCRTPLSSSGLNSRDTSLRMADFDSHKSSMEDLTMTGAGKTLTSSRSNAQSASSTMTSSRENAQSASTTMISSTRIAEKRPASTRSSSSGDDFQTPLRTNKTRMYFGFVDIGDRVVQSVQLRNQSATPLRIRCEILRPNKGFELTDKESIIMIGPGEPVTIRVSFLPTQIATYSNSLKFYIVNSTLKFTLVLHGSGGCASVSMEKHENLKVARDGTFLLETSRVGMLPLKLTNRGPRDAFVRVLLAEKTALNAPLDGPFVTPTDSIVVRAGDTRELTVSMPDMSQCGRLSSLSQASGSDSTRLRVLLLWGEEKQRQRVKRYEQLRNTKMPYEGRSFTTERFCGEENVGSLPEDTDVSRLDYDVFLSSLRRTVIKVFSNRLSLAGSVVSSTVGDRSVTATTFAVFDPDSTSASGVGHIFGRTVVPDLSHLFSSSSASASRPPVSPKRSRRCHSPPERDREAEKSKKSPGVQVKEKTLKFAATRVDAWDSVKVELMNVAPKSNKMTLWTEGNAFSVKMTQYIIDAMKFVKIPVYFRPTAPGPHQGKLFISLEDEKMLTVELEGFAIL
uniref:Abnormal spindle-like microcephaly-associated protein ASH domain-containing protein n=1 Tax=Plectus sambesii TaxID=2011161 RepID=A0A914VGG2_9BILA